MWRASDTCRGPLFAHRAAPARAASACGAYASAAPSSSESETRVLTIMGAIARSPRKRRVHDSARGERVAVTIPHRTTHYSSFSVPHTIDGHKWRRTSRATSARTCTSSSATTTTSEKDRKGWRLESSPRFAFLAASSFPPQSSRSRDSTSEPEIVRRAARSLSCVCGLLGAFRGDHGHHGRAHARRRRPRALRRRPRLLGHPAPPHRARQAACTPLTYV